MKHFKDIMKTVLIDRALDFKGRSARPEYWFFSLYATIIMFILMGVDKLIGFQFFNWIDPFSESNNSGILTALFLLGTLPASLAVTVRRIHDRGHSGWWVLGLFIPVLNFVVLYWLVRAAKDTPEAKKYVNPYGKLPK